MIRISRNSNQVQMEAGMVNSGHVSEIIEDSPSDFVHFKKSLILQNRSKIALRRLGREKKSFFISKNMFFHH